MKKIMMFAVIAVSLLLLSACSLEPVYYSEEEVMEYALYTFGNEIKTVETLTYPYDEEDNTTMFEFVFKDKHEVEFSVYSYSGRVGFISGPTAFFEKRIHNDYLEKKVEVKSEEIEDLVFKYDLNVNLGDSYCSIRIEDMAQIEDASKFIEELDALIALEYNKNNFDEDFSPDTYSANISVKPNIDGYENVPEDWYDETEYLITRVRLSAFEGQRLSDDEIFENIERAIVYDIKDGGDEKYVLPQEVLQKYPAEYLYIDNVELSHEEFSFYFSYDADEEKYYIENLDPCQESDLDFNYFDKGVFKFMAESLGGRYESIDYKAQWEIGGKLFYAELVRDEDGYEDFIVHEKNERITLDENGDRNNGTTAGRAFSLEDLEKILNAKIHIDNENQTATIEILE